MNKLMSNERNQYIEDWQQKLHKWQEKQDSRVESVDLLQSSIRPVSPPVPPHINKQIRLRANEIDLFEIWKFINKKSLFVLSWGIRGKGAEGLSQEAERLFEEWKTRVLQEKLFAPEVVYGYFRCHNKDGKLVVDLPQSKGEVVFDFPRSSKQKHLCLTDFFGENDIVAFQAVTVGSRVTEIIDMWNKDNKYTDAYYLHGLAVETAEALADWINLKIKNELNIGIKRGLRYSWGYPSCPDISQHYLVWKLLDPRKSGMRLTESGQIIPDQSTAAIVVHHPEAEYFVL
jgi:5-methyltetrahydrofolate--homocysteine methyltransferase